MDHSEEEVLSGGNVNVVVKVDDTVRRKMLAQSSNVHALLLHLESKNIPSPRFLGIDGRGREILSFIKGRTGVPTDFWDNPKYLFDSASYP